MQTTFEPIRIVPEESPAETRNEEFAPFITSTGQTAEQSLDDTQRVRSESSSPRNDQTNEVPRPPESPRLVRLPPRILPRKQFQVIQRWEGIVTDVDDKTLTASLEDLTNDGNPTEIATIDLREIPDEDLSLAVKGACFYWSVGFITSSQGVTIRRFSELRFRRLPAWSKSEIKRIQAEAKQMFAGFDAR